MPEHYDEHIITLKPGLSEIYFYFYALIGGSIQEVGMYSFTDVDGVFVYHSAQTVHRDTMSDWSKLKVRIKEPDFSWQTNKPNLSRANLLDTYAFVDMLNSCMYHDNIENALASGADSSRFKRNLSNTLHFMGIRVSTLPAVYDGGYDFTSGGNREDESDDESKVGQRIAFPSPLAFEFNLNGYKYNDYKNCLDLTDAEFKKAKSEYLIGAPVYPKRVNFSTYPGDSSDTYDLEIEFADFNNELVEHCFEVPDDAPKASEGGSLDETESLNADLNNRFSPMSF